MAEASGSRTHQRRGAPLTGFEDQAQHRQELASIEKLNNFDIVTIEQLGAVDRNLLVTSRSRLG